MGALALLRGNEVELQRSEDFFLSRTGQAAAVFKHPILRVEVAAEPGGDRTQPNVVLFAACARQVERAEVGVVCAEQVFVRPLGDPEIDLEPVSKPGEDDVFAVADRCGVAQQSFAECGNLVVVRQDNQVDVVDERAAAPDRAGDLDAFTEWFEFSQNFGGELFGCGERERITGGGAVLGRGSWSVRSVERIARREAWPTLADEGADVLAAALVSAGESAS